MFKLNHIGGPYGDETSRYDVILGKEYTVSEFINTVLDECKDEWGCIGIHKPRTIFGDPCVDYFHGDFKTDPSVMDEYANRKIKHVMAHGGWSNMDYRIYLED